MIIEARDLWYEICAARYKSDEDRISELLEEVAFLRENLAVPNIARSVANEVVDRLVREGVITKQPDEGWPISRLLERIARFEKDYPQIDAQTIDVTYTLIFHTKGDLTVAEEVEYNDVRDLFLSRFGSLIARNICVFLLYTEKINWNEGVTEPKLIKLMGRCFYLMTFLLWHKDVGDGPARICVSFEGNEFHAWLRESNKAPQRDSQ